MLEFIIFASIVFLIIGLVGALLAWGLIESAIAGIYFCPHMNCNSQVDSRLSRKLTKEK